MPKRILAILLLLLIAGSFLVLLRKNSALQEEIAALELRLASSQVTSPKPPKTIETPPDLDQSEKLELMRLRGEVTLLRQQVQELSAERDATQSASVQQSFASPIPVEQWSRVGAATPQYAAQTLLNYLYLLNTSTNEAEVHTNQPPRVGYYFPGHNSEQFTNTSALIATLLDRPGDIVSFQTGPAQPGEIDSSGYLPFMKLPVRINYADGTSSTHTINMESQTRIRNGQYDRIGGWSPRITLKIVNGKAQASF